MKFRMKKRYYSGVTKSDVYDPHAPVLPGCAREKERRALNALYGKISDAEFQKRKNELLGKISKTGNCPVLLTLLLNHGDIMVMHGSEMQKYYEVCPFQT